MTQIKIKRVYDPEETSDGFRILVDKLWPRGIKKENLHYDLWAKDITPSTPLREWYHEDPGTRWSGFREEYTHELEASSAMTDFVNQVKEQKTITLLYASKNAAENHAQILQKYLQKILK
ncbi:MAG: DUF488 family protein [Bacteroidales bacterium]|jgi:uncharacterized protein YeaO (DUF488 family)|nr:DUF488 family protein [Bacteroidales bacterium]